MTTALKFTMKNEIRTLSVDDTLPIFTKHELIKKISISGQIIGHIYDDKIPGRKFRQDRGDARLMA